MPRAAVAYAVPVLGAGIGVRRCLVRVRTREPGPGARVHELRNRSPRHSPVYGASFEL
jgi:hypothetical protein